MKNYYHFLRREDNPLVAIFETYDLFFDLDEAYNYYSNFEFFSS